MTALIVLGIVFGSLLLWGFGILLTLRIADLASRNERGLNGEDRGIFAIFGTLFMPIVLIVAVCWYFMSDRRKGWMWKFTHPKDRRMTKKAETVHSLQVEAEKYRKLAKSTTDDAERELFNSVQRDYQKQAIEASK